LPPRNDPENDTVSYVATDGESAVDLSIPVMTALTDAQRSLCWDLANKPGFNVKSAIENRSFGRPYSNESKITKFYSEYFDSMSAEDLHTLTESTLRRNRFEEKFTLNDVVFILRLKHSTAQDLVARYTKNNCTYYNFLYLFHLFKLLPF
jgi:hypothetical protein